MQDKSQIESPNDDKSFDTKAFYDNVVKGAIVGVCSTSSTFFGADKPLAHATKAAAQFAAQGVIAIVQDVAKGNFSNVWNKSVYVNAFRETWKHPVKGYPIALANSCLKNVVLFPSIYISDKALYSLTGNQEAAKNYSKFLGGMLTVYLTSPISVLKTRLMTNVPLNTLSLQRLGSGTNATALRDGVQYGVYFYAKDQLENQYGSNFMVAGMAGVIGYLFSNPLSVIGLNQKISAQSTNIFTMAKQIHKTNGPKGFYPLRLLSALGMFARGVAVDGGSKLYERISQQDDFLDKAPLVETKIS